MALSSRGASVFRRRLRLHFFIVVTSAENTGVNAQAGASRPPALRVAVRAKSPQVIPELVHPPDWTFLEDGRALLFAQQSPGFVHDISLVRGAVRLDDVFPFACQCGKDF